MSEHKSFNMYHSYLDAIELLTYEERGRLITALLCYSAEADPPELTGGERYLFPLMRSQIDRDRELYEYRRVKNSENGRKGAAKRLGLQADGSPLIPSREDVNKFCSEHKLCVNQERFYNYYESRNWHDADGFPMKSWQQKLLSWSSREYSRRTADSGDRSSGGSEIDLEKLKRSIDKI